MAWIVCEGAAAAVAAAPGVETNACALPCVMTAASAAAAKPTRAFLPSILVSPVESCGLPSNSPRTALADGLWHNCIPVTRTRFGRKPPGTNPDTVHCPGMLETSQAMSLLTIVEIVGPIILGI